MLACKAPRKALLFKRYLLFPHCRKQRHAGQHNIRLRRLRRGPDVGTNGLKMVIDDQVLSERLLQFNDVCRCQLVITDDVGFAEALDRVLFGDINGVCVSDVVEIVRINHPGRYHAPKRGAWVIDIYPSFLVRITFSLAALRSGFP